MEKLNLVILFGGQSSEHVISCMSAQNVIASADSDKYNKILIGITVDGRWLLVDDVSRIADDTWRESGKPAVISPDASDKCILVIGADTVTKIPVDVVFPVLHGPYGEDGTVQGLFELARIPYVGCGVLASSVAMDKLATKMMADELGIRQASFVPVMKDELGNMDEVISRVEDSLLYPVFVKPCNAGSSKGVTKASDRDMLIRALSEAAKHDRRILVEETLTGHEVECAVFGGGGDEVRASGVGEILAAAEFYDFDAKYYNSESKTVTDPDLPGDSAEEIRDKSVRIFKALDGYGLARVDFFVGDDGTVVFNEINTMPGFTAISMYPKLWEARGISKTQLVDDLIQSALKRYER